MQVVFERGIFLPELDLWLDSRRRRESSLISHAHSDHTSRHSRPVITPNTGLLLADYLKNTEPVVLPYGETLETPSYTLTLYPAGHCLGSAQALVQSKITGERLLYTGDLKTRPSPTNEALRPVECDVLVIESTYGRPDYVFPPQEQVLASAFGVLRGWLARGERPVVQGWRLGKAQEILHYLLAEGFSVAVEESVYRAVEAYQQAGVEFPGPVELFNGHWPEGAVALFPPGSRSKVLRDYRGKRTMELTGWAASDNRRWRSWADASFPYSDHADYNELLDYVETVKPRQIYTVFGFPELSAKLRSMGYPALHLDGRGPVADTGFQLKLV